MPGLRDRYLREVGMRRRTFMGLAGLGVTALAFGRRAWAAAGRAAARAFPRPPWKRLDSEDLRKPHDLAG